MNSDRRTDISGHVEALCAEFGLDKSDVASIQIEPAEITILVYGLNNGRAKFVDERGHAVMYRIREKVST